VVTNGTFKIDSAAQLADKLSMMNRTPGSGANKTGHEGHIMDDEMKADVVSKSVLKGNVPKAFKKQLNEVVEAYLGLTKALNKSDSEAASQAAKQINAKLSDVDMNLVEGDLHMVWMSQLEKLNNNATKLSAEQNLEKQRGLFLSLSAALIESVETFGITNVTYQQFCPMANGGKGGSWLSDSEKITNPFFGVEMDTCGETVKKIES